MELLLSKITGFFSSFSIKDYLNVIIITGLLIFTFYLKYEINKKDYSIEKLENIKKQNELQISIYKDSITVLKTELNDTILEFQTERKNITEEYEKIIEHNKESIKQKETINVIVNDNSSYETLIKEIKKMESLKWKLYY